jgi:hydrogenase maturation protease
MIVIGVGNSYRRDDGVGPAVVNLLRWRGLPGVVLAESDGEPTDMIDLWDGHDLAVVVDGVCTGRAAPGRMHRLSLHHPAVAAAPAASTHHVGLGTAVHLARALDRLPSRLLFIAVEVVDTTPGRGLSPVVAAAARRAADEVVRLVTPGPCPDGARRPAGSG